MLPVSVATTLAMNRLSVGPVPQTGPVGTVPTKVSDGGPALLASMPTDGAVPQTLPPSICSASSTMNEPELLITPSCVTVPVCPPGLDTVSVLPLATDSVPVVSLVSVDALVGSV